MDQTYDRILASISTTDIRYAIPILRWLTFSKRPLSVDEIAEIVAIDLGDEAKFDRDEVLEDPLDVLNICPSLVIITTEEKKRSSSQARQIVALAHFSVKEYLVSDRIRQGLAACYSMQSALCHDAIARSCLAYLLQFQGSHVLTKDNKKEFSLAEYAARYWASHASATDEQAETYIREAVLLLSNSDAYSNMIGFYHPDDFLTIIRFKHQKKLRMTPLYWTALSGLTRLSRLLLDQGVDVNAQNCGVFGNALQAASNKGHHLTVELLLERGADVNAHGGLYHYALHAAALKGRLSIVKLLIDHGADINARGNRIYESVLQIAAKEGHDLTIKLLLDKGADVNAPSSSQALYGNALEAASSGGHQSTVELLLDNGAEINMHSSRTFGTAIQKALQWRHQSVVELLQRRGADFDVHGGEEYGNTLEAASFGGNEVVVKQLIDKGVNIDAPAGRYYGNALQVASYRGYETMVKLLLDEGADVNAPGSKKHGSALQAASCEGHEHIIKLLLDNGADINAHGGVEYGTALQSVAYKGRADLVKLLLNAGANINFQSGGYYGNALQAASYRGHEAVVKLLLDEGADVNPSAGDTYRRTALHFAAYGEKISIFQSLIDFGLDPSALDVKGDGALTYAVLSGKLKMVQAVLRSGPAFSSENSLWSPLHWACRVGKADIIELLTKEGIRGECVTTPDGQWSPLDIAIFHHTAGNLENLSTACKSLLGPETDPGRLPGLTMNRYTCDGCFLVSEKPIFRVYLTRHSLFMGLDFTVTLVLTWTIVLCAGCHCINFMKIMIGKISILKRNHNLMTAAPK